MKLKNVKKGVRVELKVPTDGIEAGQRGVLKPSPHNSEYNCWVHFDEDVGGWGDTQENIPSGHGWTVPIKDLRRVKEKYL